MKILIFTAKLILLSMFFTSTSGAETTLWNGPYGISENWSIGEYWSAGEPAATLDVDIGGARSIYITEEGEQCRNLLLGGSRTDLVSGSTYAIRSGGRIQLLAGSLTSQGLYLGSSPNMNGDSGTIFQNGGSNTTHYLDLYQNSSYEFFSGNLTIHDGLNLASGTIQLYSQPVTISMGNALVNFSGGSVLNGESATFSAGPESLVIYKAGVSPNTLFGTFSCQGMLHEAGQTLTIGADRTIRGTGTISDPVVCAGKIVASEGGFINLDGGLRITQTTQIDLGIGRANFFSDENILFNSELKAGKVIYQSQPQAGTFTQVGGVIEAGVLSVNQGSYHLDNGTIRIRNEYPRQPKEIDYLSDVSGLNVGSFFYMGNADGTSTIEEIGEGTNLNIGMVRWIPPRPFPPYLRTSNGLFQGWGTVALTGRLTNGGRVIADGYGVDHTLDMSSFTSVVTNPTFITPSNGWWAQNHGKLVLPVVEGRGIVDFQTGEILPSYTWGDDQVKSFSYPTVPPTYAPPDAINSVQMVFKGLSESPEMSMALLATDRDDLPVIPDDLTFIGIWEFEPSENTTYDFVDLMIRYDDLLATNSGFAENSLRMFSFDNGEWVDVTSHLLTTDNRIYANNLTDFSLIAVGVPEPGMLLFFAIGIGLLRRKRSVQ